MQKQLTSREQEIFEMLLDKITPKEIAYNLKISYYTVNFHRDNIYKKLDVHSFRELLAKYGSAEQQTEHASTAELETALPVNKKVKRPMFLISLGILVFAASAVFILQILIKPSVPGPLTSITGESAIPDEPAFIPRTFDKLYLFAQRFVTDDKKMYGEQYNSQGSIKFEDIYPDDFETFIPLDRGYKELKISGTVDKKLNTVAIAIQHVNHTDGKWILLCNTLHWNFLEIGPGEFSAIVNINRWYKQPLSTLPEGYLIVELFNILLSVNLNDNWTSDFGERIPDEILDGTIMATFRNLKIEPVTE